MLKYILPLIPAHTVYCEPFFGGGAVFWAKEQSPVEIINDSNGMVVNFYEQLKNNFKELKKRIEATPYGRDTYKRALMVYYNPYLFEPVVKAWAFWVCTIQGFSNKIGSWRAAQPRIKESQLNYNKKALISPELSARLEYVQIENTDAVYLIDRLDRPDAFFYIDPPYVDSDQGHYGGYMQEHFNSLLNVLSTLKGRFLLSSYPNENLAQTVSECGWISEPVDMSLSASKVSGKRKTEMLTRNYAV